MIYSPYATLAAEVYGKLYAPNDVTNFNMVAQGDKAYLSWTPVSDLDVLTGGSYWIRHTSKTSGVTWAGSTDITKTVPGNTDNYLAPLLTGSYLIKALDSSGNESENTAFVKSNTADILALNVVYTSTQSPTFGNGVAGKGVNDPSTSNIYFDSSDNTIELASANLSTGTHDAYYAIGTHEDDVVSSGTHDDARSTGTSNDILVSGTHDDNLATGTHDDARATGLHNAILNSGSSEFNGINFVDSATGNFDARAGNFDDVAHTTNKLEDDNASFDSSWLNNIIRNTTDNTTATVTAVDSSTRLTLSSDLFDGITGDTYRLETKLNQLRDTSATFVAADVGRTVRNNTDGGTATITIIDSSNLIRLSLDLFANDHGDTWELEAGPNYLRDTGASFTSALVGRTVRNTNDATTATVSAFVNSNELTLSSGIFDNKDTHTYQIEPGYDRLYDPSASFTDEYVGKIVRNTTDNTTATISSRVNGTELVLSSGIFDNQDGEGYRIEVPNNILRDTGATFTTATHANRLIRNLDTALVSTVASVNSYNDLVLEDNIFGQTDGANYKVAGDIPAVGYYYFTDQAIDLGAIYTSRITGSLSSTGVSVMDLFDSTTGLWSPVGGRLGMFDGSDISDTNSVMEVRITQDDPASSPTWGGWIPFFIGDYFARGIEFRVKLTSGSASHNVQIDALTITIDMPDQIKRNAGVTSSSGMHNGTEVVVYTTPYKTVPTVGITLQDSNTGDYWTISSSSTTGFTVTFYNSSNTATQKTFNWISSGY